MFDGEQARLFENNHLVAEARGNCDRAIWPGELHVGQYSGHPGAEYQVTGLVKDVRIYHRVLSETEIRQLSSDAP